MARIVRSPKLRILAKPGAPTSNGPGGMSAGAGRWIRIVSAMGHPLRLRGIMRGEMIGGRDEMGPNGFGRSDETPEKINFSERNGEPFPQGG